MDHQSSMIQGATLTCHNLCYTVEVKGPGCCGKPEQKQILKDIDAIFKPGMNAIMGPTGSGKSSLLDVLAGRKNPDGLSGHLLVDGQLQPKNFKCMTGYVVQDDVVMGTLSIRENFMFSANLRLSADISQEEKEQRVQDTLSELGLTHVADSKVGTEFIRGVSGGERKRTNIGMELIISPSVLFLDEPTTGLDSSTANAVMMLLHQLARRGRTVIFSIHQPRYSIYRQCDRLSLLTLGNMLYHGPSEDALEYFSTIGYECEAHNNPPDFFLDVINGDSTAVSGQKQKVVKQKMIEQTYFGAAPHTTSHEDEYIPGGHELSAPSHQANGKVSPSNGDMTTIELGDKEEQDGSLAERLTEKFLASQWNTDLQNEINPVLKQFEAQNSSGVAVQRVVGEYTTSFPVQFQHVAARTLKNLLRNPQTSIMQVGIMVVFGLIVGVIYFDLDDSIQFGIQNRVGVFFFIVMNQVFGNLSSVELFIKERAIFIHENASGFYRVSAYFLSKVFCDTLPMRIVPASIFAVIAYFMVGLATDPAKFFIFVFSLVCIGLSAASIGFVISASVRVFAIANLLMALSFVFMMVFSGLLINLNSIAVWLRWIQYLSIFRYGLNALCINELKDMTFCSYDIINGTDITICNPEAGNKFLQDQGIPYETAWDLWFNHTMLLVMVVVFMALTYVQLRRINKLK